jgi:uncharacterized protein (DUF1684 family)
VIRRLIAALSPPEIEAQCPGCGSTSASYARDIITASTSTSGKVRTRKRGAVLMCSHCGVYFCVDGNPPYRWLSRMREASHEKVTSVAEKMMQQVSAREIPHWGPPKT